MKKKLLTLLSLFVMFFSAFALSACSFGSWFVPDLDKPTAVLNIDEKTVTWSSVENAEKYEVYVNSQLYETIAATTGNNYCNFTSVLSEDVKIYKIYVIASADGFNESLRSNIVTYINSKDCELVTENFVVDNSFPNIITNITVDSKVVTWDEYAGTTNYYVSLYTNDLGLLYFKTDINGFDFSGYVDEDEVALVRVGIKSNNKLVMSTQIYYNTNQTNATYTSKYFYIDGYVGDYNISSQEELNKLVYYAFIYKVDKLDVYFSNSYMSELVNKYGTSGFDLSGKRVDCLHLSKAVQVACNSFVETCDYDTTITNISSSNPTKNDFTINFVFNGKTPENTTEKVRTQNEFDTPYYDLVSYEKRSQNYDNFASDNKAITEYVETGEQLYHAVESGATPLFTSTSSTAYRLYDKAKQVLREIVMDEMTTYEKILSIFDYVQYNSVYDDKIVDMDTDAEPSFISYTSFYLEGVFDDGLAVCDGFSKTFSLLCNMEGIECKRITGKIYSNGVYQGLHAWNKVLLDEKWYVCDITWTVTKTNTDDFTTGGEAVNFNSKEFLSYKYFLVGDSYIANTHYPIDTAFDKSMPANSSYYFYANGTYDGTNSRIISSRDDFIDLVEYMLESGNLSCEVAFSYDYITLPVINSDNHNTEFDAECKAVKQACNISDANILCIGWACQVVDQQNKTLTYGTIYSLTLINLPKTSA